MTGRPDPLRQEYIAFKFLMDGKATLKAQMTSGIDPQMLANEGVSAKFFTMKANQMMIEGTVVGWTPVLSEKGKLRWDALKTMFEEP